MTRDQLAILPVLLPLVGALLQPIVGLRGDRAAWPLAVATAVATALVGVLGLATVTTHGAVSYAVGGWPPPWGIEIVLDALSGFTVCVIALTAAVTLVAGRAVVARTYAEHAPVYYALALLFVAAIHGMVVSADLFNVFVFLEVIAISSYALLAGGGGPALMAAFRYVVLGTVGASFYLLGVGCFYAATGTLNMTDLHGRLPAIAGSPLYHGGLVFILVGLAIKMGLFPLHGWLPDAYGRASPPVAPLVAPLATKAAAYVLARILLHVVSPAAIPAGTVLAWAGGLAAVAGAAAAARQTDPRRLLAYSSIGQMGYIAMGVGLAQPVALLGALLQLLNDVLAKSGLFLLIAAVSLRGGPLGLRPGAMAGESSGPFVAAVLMSASLVGVPPALGFFAKWSLLEAAVVARQPWLVAAIGVSSLFAVVYGYRLAAAFWPSDVTGPRTPEASGSPLLAMGIAVLAAATLAGGLANGWLATVLAGATSAVAR